MRPPGSSIEDMRRLDSAQLAAATDRASIQLTLAGPGSGNGTSGDQLAGSGAVGCASAATGVCGHGHRWGGAAWRRLPRAGKRPRASRADGNVNFFRAVGVFG
jgi:hypothetical protein